MILRPWIEVLRIEKARVLTSLRTGEVKERARSAIRRWERALTVMTWIARKEAGS